MLRVKGQKVTSSQARSIPARPKAPQPLRSAVHPDGLPSLQGLDAKRVHSANVLYSLTGDIVLFAFQKGILVSVENPASSWFWMCSGMQKVGHLPLLATFFHHCMFGSERKKHTKFLHTVPHLTLLGLKCDGQHPRRPWGKLPNGKWATAMECAYPPKLCAAMAQGVISQLVACGAKPSPSCLAVDHLSLARAAQVATGKQPGKRVKPLVPEFKSFVAIRGPAQAMPPTDKLSSSFPVQALLCKPAISSLPAGSRCIRKSRVLGESGKSECLEAEFGIPWQLKGFVSFALAQKHPKDLVQGLPQVLKDTIRFVAKKMWQPSPRKEPRA